MNVLFLLGTLCITMIFINCQDRSPNQVLNPKIQRFGLWLTIKLLGLPPTTHNFQTQIKSLKSQRPSKNPKISTLVDNQKSTTPLPHVIKRYLLVLVAIDSLVIISATEGS